MLIKAINLIIKKLGIVLSALLNILPTSPFNYVAYSDNKILGYINYFLPVTSAIAHLEIYCSAVVIYYAIRIILRWIKASSN